MPHLPQDVIAAEILVRLPVKSLLRFKCVSKSWLCLISSPKFIKTHAAYSALDPTFANYRLMLCISNDPFRLQHSSVSSGFRNLLTDAVEAEFPTNVGTRGLSSIDDSCNGLLCIHVRSYYEGTHDIFLWNPSLRISKKLPPISAAAETNINWPEKYAIGYDEANDDYKVVKLFHFWRLPDVIVEIYSLKSDSWKRIEGFKGCDVAQLSAIYANGKFHFQAYFNSSDVYTTGFHIVSLDLENEVYGTVEEPEVESYYSCRYI